MKGRLHEKPRTRGAFLFARDTFLPRRRRQRDDCPARVIPSKARARPGERLRRMGRAFHPERTVGNPSGTAIFPIGDPRASGCLALPADRLSETPQRIAGFPAPQDAIRALGGAIPRPVAAICSTDAGNRRRRGIFSNWSFVFSNPSTCFPIWENAFPISKTRKTSSKRHAAPGKSAARNQENR